MKISIIKKNYLVKHSKAKTEIERTIIKQACSFNYLGNLMSNEGKESNIKIKNIIK
jgi:hypothetical protein